MQQQPEIVHAQINFTVNMIPTAKGRPKAFTSGGKARMYTPAKTEQAERDFIVLADPYAPPSPLLGPLELTVVFVLPIPPSWSTAKQMRAKWHCSRPDLDNLVKWVADSMNRSGRWWHDDSQIVLLSAQKRYGGGYPYVHVQLVALDQQPAAQTALA